MVLPVVDRISAEWTAGRTLRLNLATDINKAFAEKMDVTDTPTFILFDVHGNEQERWVRNAPAVEDLPQ